ncbi:FERM and PDZ domain-containing protein 1 [Seriola dumerili]|uniref:FERM and PDZ domain-containing protein 1 n=1 Tax=Seriola dumerili TaxID=41447 RepID=UPI000BBEA09F|nr:FERM and PDZ domain-containing protein 1 [Seriola dumerili]
MEAQDRSRSPSRRTSRVEQVVGRWLRRSRDLGSRDRVALDGKTAESSGSDQRNYPFRFNVQIQRDETLNSHGLTLSSQTPIVVQEVTPGGPADGRLVPGDQLVKINNVAVDDLTPEQAAEIIRECQDTLTMTVLRTMLGPKSSFITPEKRAKLRSNPVKVHFAEEVEVNGHSQGNSLLFLPNVLKVYLENGQTKAFKFEPSTTVKDIVMTLKEKLSLSRIEHFSLVLEQQHSISKLLLLHDEEGIQQVVQKKEAHDYRCLFRVCFMPRSLQTLLQEDPTAFEYLYLQGVNDVLQERFAIEMRCNTALRLAALHIQERLSSCGQSPKTNLKIITKTWGIENFVSSTLLRNMREKDLRKAIGYHMKKSQLQHDPKQKGLSVDQTRINYLEELADLRSFGGKSFSATMMLQDRESMVTLLVGARYGVSQVVNHKLSILSTLTEFTSITRIELLPESEKVSLVKIYLQDIKPITLLLESVAAKDMSCLIAGYCRVFVDPNLNIFPWIDESKKHRVSAEEGYVSRCGSDSNDSSDLDMEPLVTLVSVNEKPCPRVRSSSDPDGRKRKDRRRNKDGKEKGDKSWEDKKQKEEKDADTEKGKNREGMTEDTGHKEETKRAPDGGQIQIEVTNNDSREREEKVGEECGGGGEAKAAEEQPSASETSDSCHTDSRVLTSPSSDSLDALEEDDLLSCSSSSGHPNAPSQIHPHVHSHLQLNPYSHRQVQSHLLAPPPTHSHPLKHFTTHDSGGGGCRRSGDGADPQLIVPVSTSQSLHHTLKCSTYPESDDSSLCFAELSRLVDFLPSPPEASEDDEDEEEELSRRRRLFKEMDQSVRRAGEGGSVSGEGSFQEFPLPLSPPSPSSHMEFVFNFDQRDARCYYKLCSNITPDSARSLPRPLLHREGEDWEEVREGGGKAEDLEPIPILHPPPGFGDSSSDEEFFDARDRFTSPEDPTSGAVPRDICTEMKLDFLSLSDIRVSVTDGDKAGKAEDKEGDDEEGGGRETLFQLRKRSRKRRSFMETDYTSMVSYPQPDPERSTKQDLASNRLHKKLLAEANDAQMLSSDPEPSAQTQNPSPTVSSLTHSEGEPAQLESKPILSKACSHGPGSSSGFGSHEQTKDPQSSSRTRKQEMEMEPDTMEFKSVTDLVKAASPTITVVRCRVDPDGKESADRRGDGKEEGEGQEDIDEGTEEEEKEETAGVSGNGPFTSHMFFPQMAEEDGKGEDAGEERIEGLRGNGSQRPLIGAEGQSEANTLPPCFIDLNKKGSNGFLGSHLIAQELNSYEEEHMLEGVHDKSSPLSYSPPPPPPSSPLPPSCSPGIMGRLSASTLRGKIQQLPLYLSRSHETLHQAGTGSVAQSPVADNSSNNVEITIKVTDVDDVTQTIDFETGTTAERVDSDDSDTTVTGSEVDGEHFVEMASAKSFDSGLEVREVNSPLPVQTEPKPQHRNQHLYSGPVEDTPGPITEPPAPIVNSIQRDTSGLNIDTPGPITDAPEPNMVTTTAEDTPGYKVTNQSPPIRTPIVVTTQNLNRPGLPFHNQSQTVRRTSSDRPLMGLCRPAEQKSDSPKTPSSGCRVFTICEDPSQTKTAAEVGTTPPLKPEFSCSSVLASGCESVVEGVQVPLDACGCPAVYTNCFSGGDSFDDELTVYEFSCRTQSSGVTQTSGAVLPLMTSPPVPSFLSTSSIHSPSFPRSILFSSSTSELSPLLSPLSDASDCFLSQTHKDTISRLGQQRYPEPPTGFQVLRVDVDQLLSILESSGSDRSAVGHGGRHPRDTCPAHFTENKRVLQIEARRLMSGCQKVVGIGQSPEEMLHSLAVSFRTLVELAGICLWFSGCDRCDRRNAEAVAGLADVARSFRDFCLAAERASSKRSCQDLSIKLLAKQCTALTASVFCLTQLFRTLTAL